eukprot:364426-Chlamydomonas_euryale.AAC.40
MPSKSLRLQCVQVSAGIPYTNTPIQVHMGTKAKIPTCKHASTSAVTSARTGADHRPPATSIGRPAPRVGNYTCVALQANQTQAAVLCVMLPSALSAILEAQQAGSRTSSDPCSVAGGAEAVLFAPVSVSHALASSAVHDLHVVGVLCPRSRWTLRVGRHGGMMALQTVLTA